MKQLPTLLQLTIFSLIPVVGMAEEFVVDGIKYEFWEEDMNTLRIISTEEFVQKSIDANILSIKLPSEVTAPMDRFTRWHVLAPATSMEPTKSRACICLKRLSTWNTIAFRTAMT